MEIITDYKWKSLLCFYELTKKEKQDLDWIEEETARVFRYRGNVYSLDEFMAIPNGAFPTKWHGYHSDSFFSGILIEVSEDGEQYRVGTYIS